MIQMLLFQNQALLNQRYVYVSCIWVRTIYAYEVGQCFVECFQISALKNQYDV